MKLLPKDLGQLSIEPSEACQAGSVRTWTLTYAAGPYGLPFGAQLRVGVPPYWSVPVIDPPEALGYVSVEAGENVEFDIQIAFNWITLKVKNQPLTPGERIKIIYGDTFEGSRGARCSVFSSEEAEAMETFEAGVDLYGMGEFVDLEARPRVRVSAGPASRLLVHGPATPGASGRCVFNILMVDDFGNIARDRAGRVTLRNGEKELGEADFVDGKASIEVAAGDVKLPAKPRATCGELSGEANAAVRPEDVGGFGLYFGDLHIHTDLSDGVRTPEFAYDYAREVSRLDFACVADHDVVVNHFMKHPHNALTAEKWERLKELAERYDEAGRFVTLLGYEWARRNEGHFNVYYPGKDGPLFPAMTGEVDRLEDLLEATEPHGALVVPHHTLHESPRLLDRCEAARRLRLMEICSLYGSCEVRGEDVSSRPCAGGETAREYLETGFRFGFIGSSDSHLGMPGLLPRSVETMRKGETMFRESLAGVFAREFSRDGIFEGLGSRRCYATNGPRIVLWFDVNGHAMGEEFSLGDASAPRKIVLKVWGTSEIAGVEIMKGREVLKSVEPRGADAVVEVEDTEGLDSAGKGGVAYYYARVRQVDGGRAWTSPIWVGV